MKVWECKIGEVDDSRLPAVSDGPMREAIANAYEQLIGQQPDFIFSGWGGHLTPGERRAHNNEYPPVGDAGLWPKFDVSRVDGKDRPGGPKEGARYFVLDYVNDPHARQALRAYINACHDAEPNLATDLEQQLTETQR